MLESGLTVTHSRWSGSRSRDWYLAVPLVRRGRIWPSLAPEMTSHQVTYQSWEASVALTINCRYCVAAEWTQTLCPRIAEAEDNDWWSPQVQWGFINISLEANDYISRYIDLIHQRGQALFNAYNDLRKRLGDIRREISIVGRKNHDAEQTIKRWETGQKLW